MASPKEGSSLTTECLKCSNASVPSAARIDKGTTARHFDSVKALVVSYTELMASLVAQEVSVDEAVHVQPMSFELFANICNIALAEYAEELRMESKGTCMLDAQYTSVLCTENGKIFNVSGETDSTLLYCNTPIQTWGDKYLPKKGTHTKEIGQPLAGVADRAEGFKNSVGVEAPRFWGILTTGLVWTMSIRAFSQGHLVHTRTAPIRTWDHERNEINDDNVERVTSLLLKAVLSAEKLIKIVRSRQKSAVSGLAPCLEDMPDHYDEDSDSDDDAC